MKILVVYSSVTGNTKKVAEAVAEVLPNCELYPVENAPSTEGYDFVALGYWVNKGLPDAKAQAYMRGVSNTAVGLFGTLGAWPDSDHAKKCMSRGEAMLREPERGNRVFGTFLCQGKIDPGVLAAMDNAVRAAHPMTPERRARMEEAAKHPDDADCLKAQGVFIGFMDQIAR